MHRVINKTPEEFATDHINGHGWDNRKSNLRIATCSQNQMNKKKQKNNTSGYVGVNWRNDRKKWRALINVNGKRTYLGLFSNKEDADEAYRKRAAVEFGDFFNQG